jgi:hypothetical protein
MSRLRDLAAAARDRLLLPDPPVRAAAELLADVMSARDLTPAEHAAVATEWLRRSDDLRGITGRGRDLVGLYLARAQVHATLATAAETTVDTVSVAPPARPEASE